MKHFMTYDEIITMDWEQVATEEAEEMMAHGCVGCPHAEVCGDQELFYSCFWWELSMGNDL